MAADIKPVPDTWLGISRLDWVGRIRMPDGRYEGYAQVSDLFVNGWGTTGIQCGHRDHVTVAAAKACIRADATRLGYR